MDNLNNITYASLKNYIRALELYGHKSQADVNRLLALVFIKNFTEYFTGLFSNADYNVIEKAVKCLTNTSCLIPRELKQKDYYSYRYNIYPSQNIRLTEDYVQRFTEDDIIRTV